MVDQSNYSIEERTAMTKWVFEKKAIHILRDDFQTRHNGAVFPEKGEDYFPAGNVKDTPRYGRPSKRHEKWADVAASLLRSPNKSLWNHGIPEASMRRRIKTDLGFKTSRPTTMDELNDNKELYLLGYNPMYPVESQPTFRRNMSPPYSGSIRNFG
jgi:hypothetical protein